MNLYGVIPQVFLLLFISVILFNLFGFGNSGANNLHHIDGNEVFEMIHNDIFFEIIEPEEISYTYRARPAMNFGSTFNSTPNKELFLVPVEPSTLCKNPENSAYLKGNIALAERGECSFMSKAVRAEQAGAIGIIISENTPFNDDFYIEMIRDDRFNEPAIPAAFLLGKNGHIIREKLKELDMNYAVINIPLNVTYIPFHKLNQPPWVGW